MKEDTMAPYKRKDPLIWGIILIVFGLIFLLERLDINAWDYTWKLWPVILIIWGGYKLYYGLKGQREKTEDSAKTPVK
jgi:uncharacterized membrane protein